MTNSAYRIGLYNMAVCAAALALVWLIATWALPLFNIGLAGNAGIIAFNLVFLISILAMVIAFVRGRMDRGEQLLDCGPHPHRWSFFAMAASGLGMATVFGQALGGAFGSVFAILFTGYWLFMASGRLAVHENGFWIYWGLTRWEQIASYHWADDGTLLLRKKGQKVLSRGAIEIPSDYQEVVAKLLDSFLPGLKEE